MAQTQFLTKIWNIQKR